MLRLVGAALVVASCGAAGLRSAAALRERCRRLRAMQTALELLRGELCARLTPMPELLDFMAQNAPEPAAAFFARCGEGFSGGDLQSAWREAVAAEPALLPEDAAVLLELGASLGRCPAEELSAAIDYAQSRLAPLREAAERARDSGVRVRTAVAIASGAAVAIMLI